MYYLSFRMDGSLGDWFQWRVVYPETFSEAGCSFKELVFDSDADGTLPVIEICKGVNMPVLVYPVYEDGISGSFPAGGFFSG